MKLLRVKMHLLTIVLCLLLTPFSSGAYSVLTHEAIIDACWQKSIQPLLQHKYPGTTEEQLKEAHSYAYGGAIAPDMGYFPFGSPLFTNLVHYVRSGDFVIALLEEAQDVNEYAFALGFLSHYMADKYGHFIGTNRCVPIVYPKIKRKFGNLVTYEEDHVSHKRMEFAFDVLETAKGNYASQAYHDFIGFKVSRPLLERAFSKTYGLDINHIFKNLSLAIETFRWSVHSLFPVLTKAAWTMKRKEILELQPTATSRSFRYKMARTNYYQDFGKKQRKPGIFANALGWLIRVLPKVGPLRSLKLKDPGPVAEKLFIESFDTVLLHCVAAMKILSTGNLNFANIDFDTGNKTVPGEYKLADKSYSTLLLRLDKSQYLLLNAGLKENIIGFYGNTDSTTVNKNGPRSWKRVMAALAQLRATQPSVL